VACALFAYALSEFLLLAIGIILLIPALFVLIRQKEENALRKAAIVCLGAAIGMLWCSGFSAQRLAPIRDHHGKDIDLTLTVSEYYSKAKTKSYVSCTTDIAGREQPVLLYLYDGIDLKPGNRITGNFYARYTATGEYEDPTHHRGSGNFLLLYPNSDLSVSEGVWHWRYIPADIRNRILEILASIFPADCRAFAQALLLGETDDLTYEDDTALKNSGIRHVVAVSGLHISILYSVLYLLTFHKRKLTACVGIPCLLLFCTVLGFTPSVTRACIVQLIMMLSHLFRKEYDPPTSLATAALIMLVINPLVVASVGFQLSVASVAGILALYQRIYDRIMDIAWIGNGGRFSCWITQKIVGMIAVSLSAMLFTAPLSAYYFETVSLIGVVTNMLCMWGITFLFCGIIIACVVGVFSIPAGCVLGYALGWLIRAILGVAKILSKLPLAAVSTQNIGIVIWLILSYVILVLFLLHRWRLPGKPIYYSVILFLLVTLVAWTQPMVEDYRITVLDVGQGQCIILQSEGRTAMVDCGGASGKLAADKAAGYLSTMGITKLDALIISHYDNDHAGGVPYLLSRVPAEKLILPNAADGAEIKNAILQVHSGETVIAQRDIILSWPETELTVFTPNSVKSGNESSLCVLFQKEKCDILITSDLNTRSEIDLLVTHALPDLEYLVAGHHGAATSNSIALLKATMPDVALISVGEDNRYGHPAQEILDRFAQFGIPVRRTDLEGTIIIRG